MQTQNKDWISAIVDGESLENLEHLSSDRVAQQKWYRYHLIGDAIRNDLPTNTFDLSSNIEALLEKEESYKLNVVKRSNVVKYPFMKQMGQFAIAATVAAVAIIGVQNYQTSADNKNPLPVLTTVPLAGTASPVSLETMPQNQSDNNDQLSLSQEQRVNSYFQDHTLQQQLNNGIVVENTSKK